MAHPDDYQYYLNCGCEAYPVTLTYTNWRGETAQRTVTPKRIWWGATDWHPEPQWLLTAFDAEKQADRDFAIKDFGAATPQPAARSTGGRRQMKVLIVGGPNRGQVEYLKGQLSVKEKLK